MKGEITIRTIQPGDNAVIARLIRDTLTEFGVNRPGTVFADKATDALSAQFSGPATIYYVVLHEGKIAGGAGIRPLEKGAETVCELQKMYLLPDVRGKGIGRLLIKKCLEFARENGYQKCYLETMPELQQAIRLYEMNGFRYLDRPMGNTGHFGCGIWMIKELD